MTRLKEKYLKEAKPALQEKFQYANPMMLPVLKKVVVHMGLAEASKDKSHLQAAVKELTLLTGQKPQMTRSKKAVANFKLRKGQIIGAKVTLRGKRMYYFVDRLFNIVAPRIRDFRGFETRGDGRGCYSLGLEDQQIFPEINLDEVKRPQGMHVTFVTSAQSDEECTELLRQLGLPFKKKTK